MSINDESPFHHDVALSFAGEDRQWAESLAQILRKRGIRVFYDKFEQAELWGKDLYDYLAKVYAEHARFCIIFISSHYAQKAWTNHERRNAQARAFRDHEEYILPVRLDDTKTPGIRETIGYIDMKEVSVEELADMVERKLGRKSNQTETPNNQESSTQSSRTIPLPKVKKTFSQRDKDQFLRESFNFVKAYFCQGLTELEAQEPAIEKEFLEIHTLKFVSTIYVHGDKKIQCKIWLGGLGIGRMDSICYIDGPHVDVNRDNQYSGWISAAAEGNEMHLKPEGAYISGAPEEKRFTREQAAEYLWRRFTASLER